MGTLLVPAAFGAMPAYKYLFQAQWLMSACTVPAEKCEPVRLAQYMGILYDGG